MPIDLAFSRRLGLDCRKMRYLGIKSTGHFRSGFEPIAGSIQNVDAAGVLSHDLTKLPFKHLIHAAVLDKFNMNPLIFLKLRQRTSDSTLIEAVCSSLSRADDSNIRSLGFSLLGTDVGGMKKQKCAHILIRTCEDYISQTHTKLNLIAFVAPKAEDAETLEQTLDRKSVV